MHIAQTTGHNCRAFQWILSPFVDVKHLWQFPQYYNKNHWSTKPQRRKRDGWLRKTENKINQKNNISIWTRWMLEGQERRGNTNAFPCIFFVFFLFLGMASWLRSQKRRRGEVHRKPKNDNKNDIYHTLECVYHSESNACLLCRKVGKKWIWNQMKTK